MLETVPQKLSVHVIDAKAEINSFSETKSLLKTYLKLALFSHVTEKRFEL
jgi:hypothetical protein